MNISWPTPPVEAPLSPEARPASSIRLLLTFSTLAPPSTYLFHGEDHLYFPRFSPLSSWQAAWQRKGRAGVGGVVENPMSCRLQEDIWDNGPYAEHSKPQRPPPYWQVSFNKALPTPTKQHLLMVLLPVRLHRTIIFRPPHSISWPHKLNHIIMQNSFSPNWKISRVDQSQQCLKSHVSSEIHAIS